MKAKIDADGDFDSKGKSYYDGDDGVVARYGHESSVTDSREIRALLRRYYEMAAKRDGAGACSLTYPPFVRAIPEDEGQASGPGFLRGRKTCAAIMSIIFKTYPNEFTEPIEVIGVQANGDRADVLMRSPAMPVSFTEVRRRGRVWMIDRLRPGRLP